MWFGLGPEGRTLYMLAGGGGGSDWVKNLRRDPEVSLRIADELFDGRARIVRIPRKAIWRAGSWSRSTSGTLAASPTGGVPRSR
jgi:hypothetical protein